MGAAGITMTLDAVIVTVTEHRPRILTVSTDQGLALPSGPLDPLADATLELALRRYIREQAGIEVGYVEQLYTFGDLGRRPPRDDRELSVAYLALTRAERPAPGASWTEWYDVLPWEDHREGRPPLIEARIAPRLRAWAGGADGVDARRRATVTFGLARTPWDGIRVLERYELLYEAGLVPESWLDRGVPPPPDLLATGAMAFDHRRIAATALGRLRGKLTYRPVVFELLPSRFTLSHLQATVEALAGVRLHKQNFRRLVERAGIVEGTGRRAATGGRPAELFRFRPEVLLERPRPGLGVPYR